ncbi:putative sister chromatid cohesion protein Mis4 [Saccharata proteae CBS 121410]|uniref:Sister chromatid cohesion protein n=1 Tax=Saccharata proteae CBS 121410 TaxID=1314787 RepID=A0A9P4LT43_9PEZI|nr:putative sister chromatid cohesion protein Mis4 [Saccharata proteae CBS 121410]
MNGTNGDWHSSNGGRASLPFRPPTVDQALPYSPLSSIIPFDPDPTPESPTKPKASPRRPSNQHAIKSTQAPARRISVNHVSPANKASNESSVKQNEGIQIAMPENVTPPPLRQDPVPHGKNNASVAVPSASQTKPPPGPAKRKREDGDELDLSIDQRQKADAATQNLETLISDIFEAEDQLQPDTSGLISSEAAKYFVVGDSGEPEAPVLAPNIQSKLDSAIHKVIAAKSFSRISAEQLSRVQKLCESSVASVERTSLGLGVDWSQSDVEEWVSRLAKAERGLQAARIMLRIMTAGREEKQLYSEDLLSRVLEALKHVLDTCIIPIIEARPSETDSFHIATAQRKPLTAVLQMATKVFRLLSDMLIKVDVSETAVTAAEYMSTTLIFVENAHTEKDSILGIQRCETIRRTAMDVLAKVFARYPDQRIFIFDEILTSLEKLPVTRQSARQFKMLDGKPIQLVSALLMRLIQTTATRSVKDKNNTKPNIHLEDDGEDDDDDQPQVGVRSSAEHMQIIDLDDASDVDSDAGLPGIVNPLFDEAQKNSAYVVKFLVQRALNATKSGDQPYRNLLDIFVEDFLSVLGSADWPAAELLLRAFLSNMIGLVENDKSAAPAKNMALDIMGVMGSGISDVQQYVKNACRTMDTSESELSHRLVQEAEEVLDESFNEAELLHFDGPYRVVLEYVALREINDPQLQSAQGYHLTQWARDASAIMNSDRPEDDAVSLPKTLAIQLRNMLLDPKWLEQEYDFERVTTAQGMLSAAVVALRLPFCKAMKRIFSILLAGMTSDQATVKSRSLKSVVQLVEKDPSILKNSYIINSILRCVADQSPLVRDSALGLLAKCLTFKPSLENEVCERIIARSADATIGVRKRAMKLLKDIYLRNDAKEIKIAIADALLQRIQDLDEGVADLARQTFEEIWIAPFHASASNKTDFAQSKLRLQHQVVLIIRTVQRGESVLSVLDVLLRSVLSSSSKNSIANFQVCKSMVALMFEGIIDGDELPDQPSQQHILQTLTVFAKTSPGLFTADQLQLLQPYVQNLSNTDDLLIYRSVIVIFRHVLPSLSSLQNSFLKVVQDALLSSVSKLGKMELNEVAQCLWIIDGVLQNTDRLIRLTISVINGVFTSRDTNFSEDTPQALQAQNRVKRYMMIAGYFGKCCNFDKHAQAFRDKFPWWKGVSVAGLIVDVVCPLTRQKQPQALREMAFESVGMVCQAWPDQFLRQDVITAFELVFHNRDPRLEQIVLSCFKGFFTTEEKRSETGAEIPVGEGAVHGSERLDVSLVASSNDGACTSIAQRFLQHIIRIALESTAEIALTAAQVIASITRQGLVHPKECGPALVALETSPDNTIANIAFTEHRNLHNKHESMFDKEYVKAIQRAFTYQQETLHETHGASTQLFVPKLRSCFEVLKTGSNKVRKKFLLNLASKVDFDFEKLDVTKDPPQHLLFARFCLENIAFLDYTRLDELLALVDSLEKIVSNSGTPIAHAIEIEVFKVRLDGDNTNRPEAPPEDQDQTQPQPQTEALAPLQALENGHVDLSIPEARLKHLATAAAILCMVWETRTHLRRLWNLQKQHHPGKESKKTTVKDLGKAPTRLAFVTGDKYWEKMLGIVASLEATDTMIAQCRAFVELLAIDNELKIASEDDEDAALAAKAAGYETPSDVESGGSQPASGGGRGKKRKGSVSISGTPKKKRSRPSKGKGGKKGRSGSVASHDDDDELGGWV